MAVYRGSIITDDDGHLAEADATEVYRRVFSSQEYQQVMRNRAALGTRTTRDTIIWFEQSVPTPEKGKVDIGVEYGEQPVYVLAHTDEDAMRDVLREVFPLRR